MDIRGKTAVVTGAGKGIGRATAEMLFKRGAFVVLVARRARVLEELQSEMDPHKGGSQAEREKMLKPEDIASVAEFLLTLPQNVRIDELVVLPNRFPIRFWDYHL